MPHITRAIYAFFLSVVAVGVMMVMDMLFSFGIGDFIFSPAFFVPSIVLGYLVAPYLAKWIKFH